MTPVSQRAREAAEAIVSAANIVTCDGYYEIDLDKVELFVAKFEAETLERAAKCAEAELVDLEDDPNIVDDVCNTTVSEIARAIRSLIGEQP